MKNLDHKGENFLKKFYTTAITVRNRGLFHIS